MKKVQGTGADFRRLIRHWVLRPALTVFRLLRDTYAGFVETRGSLLAAGLAYYALFSLTPMLVIALTIAGWVVGLDAATQTLIEEIELVLGHEIASTLLALLKDQAALPSLTTAGITTIIGLLVTLVGATIMFVQLKLAINLLWGIIPQPGKGLIIGLRTHFLSFLMIIALGLLFLVFMFSSTALIALDRYLQILPEFIQPGLPQLNFGLAFPIFGLFFALLFKYLPDAQLAWKDALVGAAFTSFFFTLGEFLIGRYIGSFGLSKGFGAASSLILILLWIYYSMQIILIGAKFAQVYADRHGKTLRPSRRAERVKRERFL